jgi:hypothetical protein
VKITRKGAPCHGAIGADKSATSAASSQLPETLSARAAPAEHRETKNAPAISSDAVAAARDRRAGNNGIPLGERCIKYGESFG